MAGGSDDNSTRFDPPDWTRPLYPGAMQTIQDMVQQPVPQYAGMRVAPMGPWQHAAGQMATDRALYGDPGLNAARGSVMGISRGEAQNPYASNPFTDAMISANARDMTDAHSKGTAVQNDAMAARGGGYGGSAWQEKQAADAGELAKRTGDMANNVRFGQNNLGAQLWQQDIGNVLQAASLTPQFSQIDMQDIDRMSNYGGQQQNYLQSLLDMSYNTWQGQQDYPYRQMDWFMNKLGQGSGQYGQNWSQGGGASPLGMGLGAGLLGMGMMG
jgi:hypothetical protein